MKPALLSFLALFALAGPALAADPIFCNARIAGKDVPLAYDRDEPGLRATYSMRETVFTRWGSSTCPSYVVLRSLTPELTDEERQPFCLRRDEETESFIGYDLGARDARGACKKPAGTICRRVHQTQNAAVTITTAAGRGAVRGLQALPDGSGAVIVSGSKGYVAGALEAMGGAAATLAGSPALMAGAALSVIAVGGAVYACSDKV